MPEYFSEIGDSFPKLECKLPAAGFTFFIDKEPVIKIEKGAFWYKGEKVKDANQVYERFSEWLATASKTQAEDSQVKGAVPEADVPKEQESPGTVGPDG